MQARYISEGLKTQVDDEWHRHDLVRNVARKHRLRIRGQLGLAARYATRARPVSQISVTENKGDSHDNYRYIGLTIR